MSFHYSPKIVTDGLVFVIDASNPKSYISGDTTCKSLVDGYVGSLNGDVKFIPDYGGGWEFDNLDDYILFTNSDFANPESNSFTCNIFLEQDDVGYSQNVYLSKGNGGSGNIGWSITYSNLYSGDTVVVRCNGNDTITQRASQAFPHTIGKVSMITMVINRSDNTIKGYLNGSNVGWVDGGNGPDTNDITGFDPITSIFSLKIGTRADGAIDFGGVTHLVQMYNRALSSNEVLQNYNALKTRFNL